MTSSMTSHDTIGNSTFAEPRSTETTLSSIEGPSDFTENMFDYMKGNKQPTGQKSTQPSSKVRRKVRRHLKPEESGIIIESRSEFSDDSTDYVMRNKALSSPAKSEECEVDGPSDFTANIVDYMRGTKGHSPPVSASAKVIDTKPMKAPLPVHDGSVLNGSKPISQPRATSPSVVGHDPNHLPKMNKHLVIDGPSNFTASLAAFINGTTANTASVQNASKINPPTRPMSSPAKGENFDVNGPSSFAVNLAESKRQSGNATTLPFSKKVSKNDTGMARLVAKTPPVGTGPREAMTPPDQDELEVGGPSDFTENLVDYIKGTKQYSPPTKTLSSVTNAEAGGSAEATKKAYNNAQEDILRTEIAKLQAQLLERDDTINGLRNTLALTEKKSTELESSLEQKNTTIDKLQTSLKQSNQQCHGLEFELHQMKMEVDDLQENLNDVIVNTVQHKDRVINRLHNNNERLSGQIADLRAEIGDKDLLLIENVEEIRKPQSEIDCELLKDALSKFADDLEAQYDISDNLAAENQKLEATISSLKKCQAEMEKRLQEKEEKQEKREEEWQARADLLMREIDRRGAACLQLWGQLENPGEKDAKGRQKYTYKYTKKSTKGASV